jgi:SAM-dependent methyltransferase
VTAWEFARGKLRGDPVYRALLQPDVMAPGPALLDLGCGTGLTLSMLREAVRLRAEGAAIPPVPVFARVVGVELRPRPARIAREVLRGWADIVDGDAGAFDMPPSGTVLLLDVLHMMTRRDQEQLLARVAAALEPGGAVIIREADAAAGMGFLSIRAGNRLKAIATGNWRQRFAFRTHAEWTDLLRRFGLRVEAQPAGQGTPFANLLVIGRRPDAAPLHERADVYHGIADAAVGPVLATKPETTDGV